VLASEADEVSRTSDDDATLGAAGNGDAAAAAELEQAFVAEEAQRTQDGVRVDLEHGGEVAGGRETLAWLCFTVGDRAADLGGDLLVQLGWVVAVDLDTDHGASNSSFIMGSALLPPGVAEIEKEREPSVDPEALIREARQPQRRRRLFIALVAVILVGIGAAGWRLVFDSALPSTHGRSPASALGKPPVLTLHLVGWGTPIQGFNPHGSCPDGKFETPIVSSPGNKIGSMVECDLAVSKTDKPTWGVRSTHASIAVTYRIPGGAIFTDEHRAFLFSRQSTDSKKPIRTNGHFVGRITGGSGRYAHAHGTVTGGGHGINNAGDWTVTFHFLR
jgi:hypothetical protein